MQNTLISFKCASVAALQRLAVSWCRREHQCGEDGWVCWVHAVWTESLCNHNSNWGGKVITVVHLRERNTCWRTKSSWWHQLKLPASARSGPNQIKALCISPSNLYLERLASNWLYPVLNFNKLSESYQLFTKWNALLFCNMPCSKTVVQQYQNLHKLTLLLLVKDSDQVYLHSFSSEVSQPVRGQHIKTFGI